MRLTPLSRAVGQTLARDLPPTGPGRIPLLRYGTEITPRFARALQEHGIHAVWVQDDLSDDILPDELLPEPVRAETAAKVADALDEARAAIGASQSFGSDMLAELQDVVALIAASITDSPDAALFLGDLAAADQYTHRHSVNVTALGLLIARAYWRTEGWIDFKGRRRWDRIDERLAKLGMGLLLHDIGKMVVPDEVLNKPGRLTDEEFAVIRRHPGWGRDLLRELGGFPPLVHQLVEGHHERLDGAGYPHGRPAGELDLEVRILSVADVYDALTADRVYREAWPVGRALALLEEETGSAFDAACVRALQSVLAVERTAEAPAEPAWVATVQADVVAAPAPVPPRRSLR
jgi:HD-GYP domain-containing protein (c-di-GMP phosphodiesterase class II)